MSNQVNINPDEYSEILRQAVAEIHTARKHLAQLVTIAKGRR